MRKMSEAVRAFRLSLGMTQEQFAVYLGCSTSAIVRWETGKTHPSAFALYKMQQMGLALQ